VGVSTLDVIARHPDRFEVFALTGHRQADLLEQQCLRFRPAFAVLGSRRQRRRFRTACALHGLGTRVLCGAPALAEVAAHPDVDSVMAAIVGAAGLPPCMAAARAGKRLLLANKEALVVGGACSCRRSRPAAPRCCPSTASIRPSSSACPKTDAPGPRRIDHIVLTASGGPFRSRDPTRCTTVTPEQAVAHPNWVMGRKISVDSATMMNKALEVIEARWLFDLAPPASGS
jgi:1-deoxy-D-xylulose-5-phosphate reductoisomerase